MPTLFNKLTWTTSAWGCIYAGKDDAEHEVEKGETFVCKATVKAHTEYQDEAQTEIIRLKA